MEYYRRKAEEEIKNLDWDFTGVEEAWILDVTASTDESTLNWVQVQGSSDILRPFQEAVSAPRCIIAALPRSDNASAYEVSLNTYKRLSQYCKLDPSLQPSSRTADVNFRYLDNGNTAVYRMGLAVWSHDSHSRQTRGLVPHPLRKSSADFTRKVFKECGHTLLEELGMLFAVCNYHTSGISNLIQENNSRLAYIEAQTGHGAPFRGPLSEGKPQIEDGIDRSDQYAMHSRQVSSILVTANRSALFLPMMISACGLLLSASKDTADQAAFKDQNAARLLQVDLDGCSADAQDIEKRCQTQLAVLFNLLTREDTKASIALTKANLEVAESAKLIAEAAKADSGAMKTVAIMTMIFLPATFFAALFSTPLLNWDDEKRVVHEKFWVYWAFTVPCTVVILLVWAVITYRKTLRAVVRGK